MNVLRTVMNVLLAIVLIVSIVWSLTTWSATTDEPPRQNSTEARLHTYMITLPHDQWKRDRFQQSMDSSGGYFDYKQWEGVIVRERPDILKWTIDNKLGHVTNEKLKGNIGSALAHITLWDFVARHNENDHFLIFEDNALVQKKSKQAIADMMKVDYDMLYLRALRPRGRKTQIPGLLKSTYEPEVKEPMPNVWLSSYLLKPSGARQLLEYFKEHNFDLSTTIIDRAVSRAILSDPSEKMKVFVVDHGEFFGHVETKGDTRRRENS